jgi:hypothetical protein
MKRPASLRDGSRFKIDPDPPVAGKDVDVTYVGPASEVEYQVDGHDPVKVTPDKDGKFRIKSLRSGKELMLSDNLGLPGYLHRNIVELA